MGEVTISQIENWIFDLDNTLYPESNGLWAQVDVRITDWIAKQYSVNNIAALAIRRNYFQRYGTALRGLMLETDIDPNEYLRYIYEIDYGVLSFNGVLRDLLATLPGRKVIFTSSPRSHATRVLDALGLSEQIAEVFDIEDAGYVPKPAEQTYDRFLTKLRIAPCRAIMFEDTSENLDIPRKRGMKTVLISGSDQRSVHYVGASVSAFISDAFGVPIKR